MIVKICLLAIASFPFKHCLVLVPEQANITYWSEKYLYYSRIYVTRTSRKSPYYMNLEGKIKHTWGNNVTGHLIFYEYLNNEYRRTFVEIHARGCDFVKNDIVLGRLLREINLQCPCPPREIHLLNVTVPTDAINFQLPFLKFRVEGEITHTYTNESILKGYLFASFKPK